MHFDIDSRTILLVLHGSHAYGLNTPESDRDEKGVCIKPKECYFGFTRKFEQQEHMGGKTDGVDRVIYSLEKFASLAADCNPNIIEMLWVNDSDVLKCDEYGQILRDNRSAFLSRKAKFTFSGYAFAQLKRIKTHRAWLLNPPKEEPTRKSFGLSEVTKVSKSELGAYDSMLAGGIEVSLPKDVITLFVREKAYQAAKAHYDQYINWKKTRNPKRAAMEEKFGYDGKHAGHLIRLLKMCKEILTLGVVIVKRIEDREEILAIRNGNLSYDALIEMSEKLEAECDALYETSPLPREPNRNKVDDMVVKMTEEYLCKYG